LRVLDPLIAREKCIRLLGGSSPINPTHRRGVSGLLHVAKGPFLAAAAMVMEVVVVHLPLVACAYIRTNPTVGIVEIYLCNA
jgi:hypothetical protein